MLLSTALLLDQPSDMTKFRLKNWVLGAPFPIRDRKIEIGVDLAKERA
jgi:hypothetical protein